METAKIKKEVVEILYQQLQLLAEKISAEHSINSLTRMFVDFRLSAKTILENNPTKEQKEAIFEFVFCQIKVLKEKKSVYLTETINDLVKFAVKFF